MATIFDYLITRGKIPDNSDYIFLHNMAFDESKPYPESQVDIKRGTIVTGLSQSSSGYEFCIKSDTTNKRYRCTYAWAFAKYTKDNMGKIDEYDKHKILVDKVRRESKRLLYNIDTLISIKSSDDIT